MRLCLNGAFLNSYKEWDKIDTLEICNSKSPKTTISFNDLQNIIPHQISKILMYLKCEVSYNFNIYILKVIWTTYAPTVKLVYVLKKSEY